MTRVTIPEKSGCETNEDSEDPHQDQLAKRANNRSIFGPNEFCPFGCIPITLVPRLPATTLRLQCVDNSLPPMVMSRSVTLRVSAFGFHPSDSSTARRPANGLVFGVEPPLWFTPWVRLEPIGEDAVEISIHEVAELYWVHYFAFTNSSREERLRADRGDLQSAARLLEAALQSDNDFDELITEIISGLEARYPQARDYGLGYVAAGPIEHRWNSGDTEILRRLRSHGVPEASLAQIEAGMWKSEPAPPRSRAKPRHPK